MQYKSLSMSELGSQMQILQPLKKKNVQYSSLIAVSKPIHCMLFQFYFQQLWCGSDTLFCLFFQHCRLVQTAVPPNWLFVTSKYQTVFSLIHFFILISVTYCIGCRTVLSLTDNICVPLRVVAIFNAGILCHHPTSPLICQLSRLFMHQSLILPIRPSYSCCPHTLKPF